MQCRGSASLQFRGGFKKVSKLMRRDSSNLWNVSLGLRSTRKLKTTGKLIFSYSFPAT